VTKHANFWKVTRIRGEIEVVEAELREDLAFPTVLDTVRHPVALVAEDLVAELDEPAPEDASSLRVIEQRQRFLLGFRPPVAAP
jgi:hypothetical protein